MNEENTLLVWCVALLLVLAIGAVWFEMWNTPLLGTIPVIMEVLPLP